MTYSKIVTFLAIAFAGTALAFGVLWGMALDTVIQDQEVMTSDTTTIQVQERFVPHSGFADTLVQFCGGVDGYGEIQAKVTFESHWNDSSRRHTDEWGINMPSPLSISVSGNDSRTRERCPGLFSEDAVEPWAIDGLYVSR